MAQRRLNFDLDPELQPEPINFDDIPDDIDNDIINTGEDGMDGMDGIDQNLNPPLRNRIFIANLGDLDQYYNGVNDILYTYPDEVGNRNPPPYLGTVNPEQFIEEDDEFTIQPWGTTWTLPQQNVPGFVAARTPEPINQGLELPQFTPIPVANGETEEPWRPMQTFAPIIPQFTPTPGPTTGPAATPLGNFRAEPWRTFRLGTQPTPQFTPTPGPIGLQGPYANPFNDQYKARKTLYDEIKWKDDSQTLNLRKLAKECIIKFHKEEEDKIEFKFSLMNLKSKSIPDTIVKVENDLISKVSYGRDIREFRVTDSWVRFPEMAVRYFSYNFEKPNKEDKMKCESEDADTCIICADKCDEGDVANCCKKVSTCLKCIEGMEKIECASCRGRLITTNMLPKHFMKIDANQRETKIRKENFATLILTIIQQIRDEDEKIDEFLDKEGPNNAIYELLERKLNKYMYEDQFKYTNFNPYIYIGTIAYLDQIKEEVFRKTKEQYLDIQYGFIAKKLIDVWSVERGVNMAEVGELYTDAINNLESKIRESGYVENLFRLGKFIAIEELSTDDNSAFLFMDEYPELMSEFHKIYNA